MYRSIRKTKIVGHTTAETEKQDKRLGSEFSGRFLKI